MDRRSLIALTKERIMKTMVIAYFVAWSGVWAYVMWLGVQNRRLRRRLDNLQSNTETPMRTTNRRAA
jgi:CcmD family protein